MPDARDLPAVHVDDGETAARRSSVPFLPADRSSAARTKIAEKRLERGVSQRALAKAVVLTRTT
jgi:hypothetical protein